MKEKEREGQRRGREEEKKERERKKENDKESVSFNYLKRKLLSVRILAICWRYFILEIFFANYLNKMFT